MDALDVPDRVVVAPVGYENDRIVLPAAELSADRVILLVYDDETDHPSYLPTVRERLDERGIDHESVPCDIFDFYDCIGTVGEVVTAFADEEVYVNLASGTKITAIGGMIACMATGATPFYVRAEAYGPLTDSEVAEGIRSLVALPTYPIEYPSPQQVTTLRYLAEDGPATKKQLIRFGAEAGLPAIADHDSGNRKGKYRRLDARILDDLAANGYVEVDPDGRSTTVSITDTGRDALRAFAFQAGTAGASDLRDA